MVSRRTIEASNNPAVVAGMKAKNNGRYNGNGRHWETPPELFAELDAEFHFTLDPCATQKTAKCARFYIESDASGFFPSVVVVWKPVKSPIFRPAE